MNFSKSTVALALVSTSSIATAFVPTTTCNTATTTRRTSSSTTPLKGYLDDISEDLYGPDDNPDIELTREATNMDKSQIDRAGPGSFADFVDFNEFDGGDGQMGVAGDGNAGLEKIDAVPELAKSKSMSAKNAWGTSTGYADTLRETDPGMDTARAQQLENWANQREVRAKSQQMQSMAEAFDNEQSSAEEDWRQLAKFGVERNEEFDLDEAFGSVTAGEVEDEIELKTALGKVATHNIMLKNPYMGFADFRAAFTPETPMDWIVEPNEGSIGREETEFVVKFKPQGPGLIEGYLVIETEDFKKTWHVMGST